MVTLVTLDLASIHSSDVPQGKIARVHPKPILTVPTIDQPEIPKPLKAFLASAVAIR